MPRVPLDERGRVKEDAPVPDPELLKKDPMAEIFGPGSGVKLIGDRDDEIPDEVKAVLDEYGLSQRSFTCMLKEVPEGSTVGEKGTPSNSGKYIKGWIRSVPSQDYIAREYGPGTYILQFTWRTKNDDPESGGPSKQLSQTVMIEISEKFMEEYKKHRLNAKIRTASEIGSQVHDALVEKKLEGQMIKALTGEEDGQRGSPAQIAKEYIGQTLETVKMLGIPIGQPQRTIEWDKLLPSIVAGVTAFLSHQQQSEAARRDEFNKMLMLMMTNNQTASQQLFEIMKSQAGIGSGANQFKEIRDMIFGALEIKNALAGEQRETVADRVFRIVESVAPQILQIASTTAQAQAGRVNPVVGMAKQYMASNKDFQTLKQNPEEMKAFITKLDNFFGWKQSDIILQVAGWERPPDCEREPSKEMPPQIAEPEPAAEEALPEEY